jgi:adenylylsulfate kinase
MTFDTEADGFTVWITGLPRSGKSTVARKVVSALQSRGLNVELLNSARIRREVNRSLGFTREEIDTNIRRLGYECKLLNRNGVVTVVTAVAPYRDARRAVRDEVGRFVEVYCHATMDVLEKRDKRQLFERARRGEIQHVAGINAPYEEPESPEVLLDTNVDNPDDCATKVIDYLEEAGLVEKTEQSTYTHQEEEMIKRRLRDLGYL